jgi:hypothetical protein
MFGDTIKGTVYKVASVSCVVRDTRQNLTKFRMRTLGLSLLKKIYLVRYYAVGRLLNVTVWWDGTDTVGGGGGRVFQCGSASIFVINCDR